MALLPTLQAVVSVQPWVYEVTPPTPQYAWPLLQERLGCEVWVKHENHTPLGAFKLRGGIVYLRKYLEQHPDCRGVITATKGNHGQSVALAAKRLGLPATIVVPENNSLCTNQAMRSLGATVIPHGQTAAQAFAHAEKLAADNDWHAVPGFHPWLLEGVSTYALELFENAPPLDAVYVAIGKGSGICSVLAMKQALGLATEIIGVVSAQAPAFALSVASGKPEVAAATTLACGVALTSAEEPALSIVRAGASRVITVPDDLILKAMAVYYHDTHQVACGAGAAALAGLMAERQQQQGRRVGVVLSGGNVDADLFVRALETPLNV